MIRLIAIAMLFLAGLTGHAGTRLLEPGTPLFTGDPARTPPETIVTEPVMCQTGASRSLWQRNGFAMYRFDCLEVTLPDGRHRIAVPQLDLRPDGTTAIRPGTAAGDRIWQGICLLAAAVLLWRIRKQHPPAPMALRLLPPLIRSGLLISILSGAGAVYLFSSDEPDFFVTCASLMQGDFSRFQPRSLGTGLWYLPFALLTGVTDITGILAPFSYFSAFAAVPAAIFCWQCAAERLTDRRTAFAAAMLFAVLPLFWFHFEPGSGTTASGVFLWPSGRLSYEFYQTMIAGGFCAMSDTPALTMLFASLLLALLPPRPWNAAACGICFGMALLLRINALLFLPALLTAPLCIRRDLPRREWLIFAGWMLALTTAVMVPQLLTNALQLGHPLTFPYVRYENTADGFALANMAGNWPLLMRGNRVFLFAGLTGLMLMPDRRTAGWLALWVLPTLLFFLGYYHTRDDLVRFILPLYAPLLLAAWTGWRHWLSQLPQPHRRIAMWSLLIVFLTGSPVTDTAFTCWQIPAIALTVPVIAAAVLTATAYHCRRTAGAWLPALTVILYLAGIPC